MAALTATQLNKILETNSRAIEIYMATQDQYEKILETLEKLGSENKIENKEQLEKIKEALKVLEGKLSQEHIKVVETTNKIEKTVSKQNLILIGSFVTILLAIIGKIFGLPIP